MVSCFLNKKNLEIRIPDDVISLKMSLKFMAIPRGWFSGLEACTKVVTSPVAIIIKKQEIEREKKRSGT